MNVEQKVKLFVKKEGRTKEERKEERKRRKEIVNRHGKQLRVYKTGRIGMYSPLRNIEKEIF